MFSSSQWDVEIDFCIGYAQSNQHIFMNILVLLKPFASVISIPLIYLKKILVSLKDG